MITHDQINSLHGHDVHDRTGDRVGSIAAVWSQGAGQPAWAAVKTGWFGLGQSLVPLRDADLRDDRVVVPYEKAFIKDAPDVDADSDEPLSNAEVDRLYEYYSMDTPAGGAGHRGGGRHARDTAAGRLHDAITRSEGRLDEGTGTGRGGFRKHVVTGQPAEVPVTGQRTREGRGREDDPGGGLPGGGRRPIG